ncbi:lytic transglycosylase domain-containing protein [Microbacterium invictum]|uniref:Lytic transglycosylase domain-containing protein n=1 Tax=Microbacterium invictum TaxID=515415 RepID=A0ABZ0VF38_9MICO|nr:lytic transglycosylase domain-containing protein [Microbacterium invictum]WQB71462.1 lytic transglycosylase domain-containing protein [Microbacterium invictum]
MRSTTTTTSARRARRAADRRSRRRPALVVAGLSFSVLAAIGITATAPTAAASTTTAFGPVTLASYSTSQASPLVSGEADGAAEGETAGIDATATDAAGQALAAAETIEADIQAAALDIGDADPTVDTAELEAALDRLESADILPAAFLPDIADDVTEAVAAVDQRVSQLRGSLDGALAKKAEEEAAEKARLEAEAAAAAAAAEAAALAESTSAGSSSGGGFIPTGGSTGGDNSPAGAQATARAMLGNYGWGDDQFSCLVSLWNKESGWNYQAYNRSSGAFGIPQALPGSKMASAGADWQTNAATQISWGLGYISGRYGTPCGAWSHSQSVGWY